MLILAPKGTGCVSIPAAVSLICVPVGIKNSAVGIQTCATTKGSKIYKSIIKKSIKKHYKIVLLGKNKVNTIKVLISKGLIDLYVGHVFSVNNVPRKYRMRWNKK